VLKILFMPFLNIQSGHHQAADALIECIQTLDSSILCEKIDILQYSFGDLEKWVSSFYLKWIHFLPGTYDWIYTKSACRTHHPAQRFRTYELLFEKFMYNLINEKKPDLIICTHALPSYIISRLKTSGLLSTTVVNVYTDFFINNIWGLEGINYHLVPDVHLQQYLISKGVQADQIYVTGIPVHPKITKSAAKSVEYSDRDTISVLITGGSLGVGVIKSLIAKTANSPKVVYKVLCGKNERLFHHISRLNQSHLIPVPYIHSREQMNHLYNQTDAILTKPGGVTISESLYKALPIFVYHALPGQEERNLLHLKQQGLVFHLADWKSKDNCNLEQDITNTLQSGHCLQRQQDRVKEYQEQIADNGLLKTLSGLING
jgi:processive 1,2-diacylglycerol beta-glucosyltransferase